MLQDTDSEIPKKQPVVAEESKASFLDESVAEDSFTKSFVEKAEESDDGIVRTACHSTARLCVNDSTSSLDNFVTCSMVAVGHALSLAEPGAGHSTADARMSAHSVSRRYVNISLKSQYPTKFTVSSLSLRRQTAPVDVTL